MIFIGGSSLINMAIGLLTTPVITRLVVPESFGQLSIFTMYTNLAVMILCLGMDQTLVRFYYESEDIKYKRELLRECVMLPLLMTLIGSIVAWGLAQYELIHFEFEP